MSKDHVPDIERYQDAMERLKSYVQDHHMILDDESTSFIGQRPSGAQLEGQIEDWIKQTNPTENADNWNQFSLQIFFVFEKAIQDEQWATAYGCLMTITMMIQAEVALGHQSGINQDPISLQKDREVPNWRLLLERLNPLKLFNRRRHRD